MVQVAAADKASLFQWGRRRRQLVLLLLTFAGILLYNVIFPSPGEVLAIGEVDLKRPQTFSMQPVLEQLQSGNVERETSTESVGTNATTTTKPWKYFPWKLPQRQNSTRSSNDENTVAIFMISMGQTAEKFRIVERLWLSIRRVGDFFGPFIVLTDASPNRYLGIQEADPNFFPIHPPNEHFNWNADFVDTAMPYKRFKTYLLEYLRNDNKRFANVEYVLYLDADVVIGKPLQPWLDYSKSQLLSTRQDASCSMLFFQGNFDDMPIQSGQFALNVETAQPCLEGWRSLIDAHPELNKDQYSLKLLHDETSTDCKLQILPQHPWLVFVKKENIKSFLKKENKDNHATFMHVQNTGHARYMQDNIVQKFFEQLLQLTEEEKKLNWKTPIRPSPEWSREQLQQSNP